LLLKSVDETNNILYELVPLFV